MQADAAENVETERKSRGALLPLIAALVLGGAGFGSAYLGYLGPLVPGFPSSSSGAAKSHPVEVGFVALPPIELTLTGGSYRRLGLSAAIETEPGAVKDIEALLPRVSDSFNAFLADVDPLAFDKRGVLEIIKFELAARARDVLAGLPVHDLLITEFKLK